MLSTEQLDILEELFPSKEEIYLLWEKHLNSPEKLTFFYKALQQTIDAYTQLNYTAFDGHTTSNCCHAMAVLTKLLINSLKRVDILKQKELTLKGLPDIRSIDWRLLLLTCLYLLNISFDPSRIKTIPQNLYEIAPLTRKFADTLIGNLQKYFSNKAAISCSLYSKKTPAECTINGISAKLWGKYVSQAHVRTNMRGVQHVSHIFSLQTILAYLIYSKTKIALVSDLIDMENQHHGQYVQIFEGDGRGNFNRFTDEQVAFFEPYDLTEPLVAIRGIVQLPNPSFSDMKASMDRQSSAISSLVLARASNRLQFPKISIDPNFDNSPIIPEETSLQKLIEQHAKIKGTSTKDASLLCVTHIFPASLLELLSARNGNKKTLKYALNYFPQTQTQVSMG